MGDHDAAFLRCLVVPVQPAALGEVIFAAAFLHLGQGAHILRAHQQEAVDVLLQKGHAFAHMGIFRLVQEGILPGRYLQIVLAFPVQGAQREGIVAIKPGGFGDCIAKKGVRIAAHEVAFADFHLAQGSSDGFGVGVIAHRDPHPVGTHAAHAVRVACQTAVHIEGQHDAGKKRLALSVIGSDLLAIGEFAEEPKLHVVHAGLHIGVVEGIVGAAEEIGVVIVLHHAGTVGVFVHEVESRVGAQEGDGCFALGLGDGLQFTEAADIAVVAFDAAGLALDDDVFRGLAHEAKADQPNAQEEKKVEQRCPRGGFTEYVHRAPLLSFQRGLSL